MQICSPAQPQTSIENSNELKITNFIFRSSSLQGSRKSCQGYYLRRLVTETRGTGDHSLPVLSLHGLNPTTFNTFKISPNCNTKRSRPVEIWAISFNLWLDWSLGARGSGWQCRSEGRSEEWGESAVKWQLGACTYIHWGSRLICLGKELRN